MSDDLTFQRQQQDLARRIGQTEVRESLRYATGTWTPAFAGTTIAGTFTYNVQTGFYTRIGNRVFVNFFVGITAIAVAPTGNMTITGLPFPSANVANGYHGLTLPYVHNLNMIAGAFQVGALIDPNTAAIRLVESTKNAAVTNFLAANFTNAACQIIGSGAYAI